VLASPPGHPNTDVHRTSIMRPPNVCGKLWEDSLLFELPNDANAPARAGSGSGLAAPVRSLTLALAHALIQVDRSDEARIAPHRLAGTADGFYTNGVGHSVSTRVPCPSSCSRFGRNGFSRQRHLCSGAAAARDEGSRPAASSGAQVGCRVASSGVSNPPRSAPARAARLVAASRHQPGRRERRGGRS
jgi:hypothetical protein